MSFDSRTTLSTLSEQATSRKFGTFSPASTTASTPNNKENYFQQNDSAPQPVGVPEGCIVRNTFLEWQESGEQTLTNGSDALTPSRRSKSCPKAFVKPRDECNSPSTVETGSPCTSETGSANGEDRQCRHGAFALDGSSPVTANQEDEHRSAYAAHTWQLGQSPHGGRFDAGSEGGYAGSQNLKPYRKGGQSQCASDVLVLRGLPFNVIEADVAAFLEQAGVSDSLVGYKPISLLSNASGKPSGFAEIQLKRDVNYWEVQEKLHMQRLGSRYIEVLPPRGVGGRRQWRDRQDRRFA